MKINEAIVQVEEFEYNKTKVQPDGITHIIDTDTKYKAYQLELYKTYFHSDRKEVTKQIIKDLRSIADKLQVMLENEKTGLEQEEER